MGKLCQGRGKIGPSEAENGAVDDSSVSEAEKTKKNSNRTEKIPSSPKELTAMDCSDLSNEGLPTLSRSLIRHGADLHSSVFSSTSTLEEQADRRSQRIAGILSGVLCDKERSQFTDDREIAQLMEASLRHLKRC